MKAYLLTYSALLAPQQVQQILNKTQAVRTWIAPFPYAAIIVSELETGELSAVLHSHFEEAWFILAEANATNTNGWLPAELWEYVLDPYKAWSSNIFTNPLKNESTPSLPRG